jgi:L,D-transpeptidase catalytic domain
MVRVFGFLFFDIILFFTSAVFAQQNQNNSDFAYLRDTVYTLKPYFIEVDLSTQKGYLYSRIDSVFQFDLSSGTKKLEDGVDTKPGLFVIQNKMEKWYSRQFDSTLMLNWMGFNWGIGFHALQGNHYYKYLGNKKSSHGCIRLSRQTSEQLYSKVDEGTPVLVHNGNSALKIEFADSNDSYIYLKYEDLGYQLKKVYQEIYSGKYFITYNPKLLIDVNNVYPGGLPVGDSRKITPHQTTLPLSDFIQKSTPNPKGFMLNVTAPKEMMISLKMN